MKANIYILIDLFILDCKELELFYVTVLLHSTQVWKRQALQMNG